jgi:3-oxoacyl-[acyl-carrier protein] reductase
MTFYLKQQVKSAGEVAESIRAAGGQAQHWEGDLGDERASRQLFRAAEQAFGQVDILVNNAATHVADTFRPADAPGGKTELWKGGPLISTFGVETHDHHFAVNSRASALLMTHFARRIIERGTKWGRIVNITADCAWGCPNEISYRASKYALESYTRSAAAELGPHGITVNAVSPGPIQSGYIAAEGEKALIPDIPMRRVGQPQDIANAVLFFASNQSDWITGQLLFVHGGHRMAFGQQVNGYTSPLNSVAL